GAARTCRDEEGGICRAADGSAEHRSDERGRDAGRAVRGQVDTGVNDPQAPTTQIPTRWVGPMRVSGNAVDGEFSIPLATYETPLWPSVGRGARVSRRVEGGIRVMMVDERMSRSVLFTASSGERRVGKGRR